ncbi:MAG: hypothetical protein QOE41_1001, partial [Mycobacterium sp.]|nr:hypothetical protein [Mycobacterium sp.]
TRSHAAGSLTWARLNELAVSPPGTTVSSGPSTWRRGSRSNRLVVNDRGRPGNSCRRLMSGDSTPQLLPVGRHTSGRSRRRLIQWVMFRWGELRAVVVELLIAVVVEPMFRRLVTGEHGMSGCFSVGGGVLARRVVATADMAALSTPAQMKPPAALLFALHTARSARRNSSIDAGVVSHRIHETRPWVPEQ